MNPILPGAPWLIAHRSMLGVNKPCKIRLNYQDYVLWQNSSGEVFALENICPHLQAPLSEGWICAERNTITCPFHALEFDGQGYYRPQNPNQQPNQQEEVFGKGYPLIKSLPLEIRGDLIWTYGKHPAKLPIPDLIERGREGYEFVGATGCTSIRGGFLENLLVNYDYNHQNGTHREMFRLKEIQVSDYKEAGYHTTLKQHVVRDQNTLVEILRNPVLKLLPQTWTNDFEYAFPCLTTLKGDLPFGKIFQIHSLYPEDDTHTRTFILLFAQLTHPLIKLLQNFLRPSLLATANTIIKQDSVAIETSYPRQPRKIRLPNEHIMDYAEKLYRNWPT
jgi:phenylpropionate dioxygenase-like ring-hydroxylating dioxygenase large terminal subunit